MDRGYDDDRDRYYEFEGKRIDGEPPCNTQAVKSSNFSLRLGNEAS